MYKKDKSFFLSSSLSPFPKNLSIQNPNHQTVTISSAHKYRFNIITFNPEIEDSSKCKEVSIETDKNVVVDKDYIIQLYNSDGKLLFSHSFTSNPNDYPENSYASGIAALISSIICVGGNNGSILKFLVNDENNVSFDETSNHTKHKRPISDLVSDGQKRLISCDDCGKICVWDYNTNTNDLEENVSFEGYNGFSCNCLGIFKTYLCAGYGSGHLRVFDIQQKTLICEISAHAKWVTAIDVAVESGYVLSTSEDSFVRVWQIKEENDSIKVCHKFSQNIENTMIFGGVFLKSGKAFCVGGYDSIELHCFKSE